ncbi:uncharacterized protein MAM_07849 [Metarhizium album ARSEF 1941]|uniref:Uncharacterized protein n=1 Tax=Metarhizium album (strain ARSEF 1941) TaxID=1081103 RepID=A0A0B2WMU0_METAS|nr:uncharacterized protein MAM_07849 [Metarhizium album ARSEF 1941]KHN94320.1 hypothetical protein MAM_07849 [Metarhizium album ARSEF 1941]
MQFRQLQENDTIRFGIPIQKGSETFPPCEVKVSLFHGSQDPKERPVVFRVPDSSDEEDGTSDVDEAVETSVSLIQNAGMTLDDPQKIGAIDLTSEEHTGLPDTDDPNVTIEVPELSTPGHQEPDNLQFQQPSISWPDEAEELEGNDDACSPPESASSSIFDSDDEDFSEIAATGGSVGMETEESADASHMDATLYLAEADIRDSLSPGLAPSHLRTSSGRGFDILPPLAVTQTAQPGDIHLPSLFDAIPSSSYHSLHFDKEVSAESLGAKSGKSEYFEAREHNRRICLGREENKENDFPTSFQQLDKAMESSIPPLQHTNILTTGLPHNCTSDLDTAALLASGEKFLRTPVAEFNAMPSKEDNLDDTSAYTFELSKRGAELVEKVQPRMMTDFTTWGEKDKPVPESRPEYSEEAPRTNQHSFKRKSDAISELLPNETEPNSSQTIGQTSTRLTGPASNAAQLAEVPQVELSSVDVADHRPAKRFRRVAEVVGYAALGGIAVMSALIATAPVL